MPLITQTSSNFGWLTGSTTSPSPPPPPPPPPSNIEFPADSIVPYYSTGLPPDGNWDFYSTATDKFITGTTSAGLLGTTTNEIQASGGVALSTTGSHTGSTAYRSCASSSTGSTLNSGTNTSAGNHGHSGSFAYQYNQFNSTPSIIPQHSVISLIRANKNVTTIPPNSIAFRNAATGTYGTRYGAPSAVNPTLYFKTSTTASSLTTISGISSSTAYSSTSSAGTHRHHSNTNQYFIDGKTIYSPLQDSGLHMHNLTGTLTQKIMNSTMVLDAWTSATARIPLTDVVVMFVGNPANLPSGWFLCNGLNGTINMNGYYVAAGVNSGTSWGTIRNSDASQSVTVATAGSHSHVNSTAPKAGYGILSYHDTQTWDHTHTATPNLTPYSGGKLYLYFIQYKG
jgi:hypothetical protein